MHSATTAAISFTLASAVTLTGLWWPTCYRPGWFELDGRPCAVDGEPVRDWQHANDVLARSAPAIHRKVEHYWHPGVKYEDVPREIFDCEFTIDYVPTQGDGRVHRVIARRFLPTQQQWGREHPIAAARYEIANAEQPASAR